MPNKTLIKIFIHTSNFVLNEDLSNLASRDYVESYYKYLLESETFTADDCSENDFLNYVCCFVSLFTHMGFYDN